MEPPGPSTYDLGTASMQELLIIVDIVASVVCSLAAVAIHKRFFSLSREEIITTPSPPPQPVARQLEASSADAFAAIDRLVEMARANGSSVHVHDLQVYAERLKRELNGGKRRA